MTAHTNKSSLEYQQLQVYLNTFVDSSLRSQNLTGFQNLQILNLRNGSILVNSKYTYDESGGLGQEQVRSLSAAALTRVDPQNLFESVDKSSIRIANLQSPPLANETTYDHVFYIFMNVNGSLFNLSKPDEYAIAFPQIMEFLTTSAINITQDTQLSIIRSDLFASYYEFVANFTLLRTRVVNESEAQAALLAAMIAYTGPFPVVKDSIKFVSVNTVTTTLAPPPNNDEINAVAIFVPIIIFVVVLVGFGALFFYKFKKSVRFFAGYILSNS